MKLSDLKNEISENAYSNLLITDIDDKLNKCICNIDSGKNDNLVISIIISTHNRADLLKRALLGIFQQKFKDFEVIVVDDSTNDETKEFINKINNSKIKYFREKQNYAGGISKKVGYLNASGEYIIFSDDDDYFIDDDYFSKLVSKFRNNDNYSMIISNSIVHHELNNEFSLYKNNIYDGISNTEYFESFTLDYKKPTSMFPMALNGKKMKEIGYENLKFFGDTSLYLYGLLANGQIGLIEDYIGVYRVQKSSVTTNSTVDYMLDNFNSKLDIFNIARNNSTFSCKDSWLYKQLLVTINWHFNSKKNSFKDNSRMLSWCFKNVAGIYKYKICAKIFMYMLRSV